MEFRERIRQGLEMEVDSLEVGRIFDRLRERHPVLIPFKNAIDLVRDMHKKKITSYEEKDWIIAVLIEEYQQRPESKALGSLLSLLFWPAIDHIYYTKWNHFSDAQELWSEVHWAFLNTILKYPLLARPKKLAMNIKLDTLKKLCRWQGEELEYRKVFVQTEEDVANQVKKELPDSEDASDWTEDDIYQAQEFLHRFVEEGVITETDYYLIIGTRIYGNHLNECAPKHGLTPEAAKKRRQRAEKAIWNFLKNKEK